MKALIASVALLLTAPARADEIVIASPAAWCPLSCQAGSAREGFAVDIAREIFTAAGHRVRLVNEPYSRAILDVRAGVFTATASTFREEAPDFVFIEIAEEGNGYEVCGVDGTSTARIGLQALASALPPVLVYELSKSL